MLDGAHLATSRSPIRAPRPRAARTRPTLLACLATALLGCAAAPPPSHPIVRSSLLDVPTLFGDHMVLQRRMPVPVWGTTGPGERVTITFRDQRVITTADPAGRWAARLAASEAGGPFDLAITAGKTITLHDVLVGEVWLASGQSNMSFQLRRTDDAARAIAASSNPRLRMFTVSRDVAAAPERALGGRWDVASPEASPDFSAVAYHLGRELQEALQVPVGIVHASWAGTPIEAWMSAASLHSDPSFQSIFDAWAAKEEKNAPAIAAYEPLWKAWRAEADAAQQTHHPFPEQPEGPLGPRHQYFPSNPYNAMIAPLAPYAIRGFLWYQGEGNRDRAAQYRALFPTLIHAWRAAWGEGEAPFLFVQLAAYGPTLPRPAESRSAELRDAQASALALPNTAMAVTIDIGDPDDVHPKNKREVGRRLALAARAVAYGERLVSSGPRPTAVTAVGSALRVHFDAIGSGLVAKGGGPLVGFAVAGADGHFAWADATIEGDAVVVRSPGVKEPRTVRYAWGDSPACNLINQEGLPASPFQASAP
jgi:sialate O-acetylesterase